MVKKSLLEKHLVLPKDKLEYFKRHCGKVSVEEMTKMLGIDVREYCKIKKQLGLIQPDNIILRGVRARVESREDWKRKHLYGQAK